MPARRLHLEQPPFPNPEASLWARGVWPAQWIHLAPAPPGPLLWLARLTFELPEPATLRIHVSADERYDLALDGERVGRGPERGDVDYWMFESYELSLAAGVHRLLARLWHLGSGHAPTAQLGVKPGFLLAAEGPYAPLVSTGSAAWLVRTLPGYALIPALAQDTGSRVQVSLREVPWADLDSRPPGHPQGATAAGAQMDAPAWQPATVLGNAIDPQLCSWWHRHWRLTPAMLPAMRDEPLGPGILRHLERIPAEGRDFSALPITPGEHLADEAPAWQAVLSGRPLVIPAHTARRAIIDLGEYHCAHATITLAAGSGAFVRLHWAESLYEPAILATRWPFDNRAKGHRSEIHGKIFRGQGDAYLGGGGAAQVVEGLWWSAGRYLELVVQTAQEPLTIQALELRETGFPWQMVGRFASDDASLARIEELSLRTLRSCSHETFMDCPYYEQMQYIGDTRLQVLVGYVMARDDQLARKALIAFDQSRFPSGLTCSRYPSRDPQIIPGFSLWWVGMVHDQALWRDDLPFVRSLMPGVRAVLECFLGQVRADGLVHCPEGWNFLDWVPTWDGGHAPGGDAGASLQWHLAWSLELAAQLEEALGEIELASRNRRHGRALSQRAWEVFYDPATRRLADDAEHTRFSEHATLALLSESLDAPQRAAAAHALLQTPGLELVTVYFSHYLFEAYQRLGRGDLIRGRLALWQGLSERGLTTVIETPEPTRSDCHAWGAHPVYHCRASLLGVRPAGIGFSRVSIMPSLGGLTDASARIPHPHGELDIALHHADGALSGRICLPGTLSGVLRWGAHEQILRPGAQEVSLSRPHA